MCDKTEFEVEGWRKIPPLMKILENNIPAEVIAKMRLESIEKPQVIPKDIYDSARATNDVTKLNVRTIRQSWIYNHFKNADTKDTQIVNAVVIYLFTKTWNVSRRFTMLEIIVSWSKV